MCCACCWLHAGFGAAVIVVVAVLSAAADVVGADAGLHSMVPLVLMLLICINLAQLTSDRMSQPRAPSWTSPSARRQSPQNQNQTK